MTQFFEQLKLATAEERGGLVSQPIIHRALSGDITRGDYVLFLTEAYHHVKHTVPLLMLVGSKLSEEKEWLRVAVADYIDEEMGHQEWILSDIAACGADEEAVRNGRPRFSTELMVSYAYDMIQRVSPLGFFGMVHVLEGTSIDIAELAADSIREALALPKSAFTYLYSHGALDQRHVLFFQELMNRIDDPSEQETIVRAAKAFYRLYGDIFRELATAASPTRATPGVTLSHDARRASA